MMQKDKLIEHLLGIVSCSKGDIKIVVEETAKNIFGELESREWICPVPIYGVDSSDIKRIKKEWINRN